MDKYFEVYDQAVKITPEAGGKKAPFYVFSYKKWTLETHSGNFAINGVKFFRQLTKTKYLNISS